MKKRLCKIIVLICCLCAFSGNTNASVQPKDPWYIDIPVHYWAHKNIRTLWEEDVLDGYVYVDDYFSDSRFARFVPNDICTRAQFMMMLVKTLQLQPLNSSLPTFIDVPINFTLYYNKPAFNVIEAAHYHGLTKSFKGPYFKPDLALSREEAAALLIHALDLTHYAESLPPSEVDSVLSFFSDNETTSPLLRNYIAAAVKLQILYGYGTDIRELRPLRPLTRDEAAVILYRSCLVRAQADPERFNPHGDGEHQTTNIQMTALKNRNMVSGSLSIRSEDGLTLYREFTFTDKDNAMWPIILWDGKDQSGQILPPGTYYYQCEIVDRKNQVFSSTAKPITIDQKILDASLHPPILRPGESLEVSAQTYADAISVVAHFSNQTISLWRNPYVESTYSQWTGRYFVPSDAEEKEYVVYIEARYPYSVLCADLSYHVIDPILLQGNLEPVVLRAGEKLTVQAFTSDNVVSVEAFFPFGTVVSLAETASAVWHGTTWVPIDSQDGIYTVQLRAKSMSKTLWLPLNYTISGNIMSGVCIILTD